LAAIKLVQIQETEPSQEQNAACATVADGGSLAVVVTAANVHDCKFLDATLEAIIVKRPKPQEVEQHLCLDKVYDNPTGRAAVD